MRLIVLDTNVVVSAGIKPGSVPNRLLAEWIFEGKIKVVNAPSIAAEYRAVCTRGKFAAYGFPPPWLEYLIAESMMLDEPEEWPLALPDSSEGVFLALAKATGAWLITGNLKHYPEELRAGVQVISPAEYLERLSG